MSHSNRSRRDKSFRQLIAAIRDGDRDRVRAHVQSDPSLVGRHDPDAFGATPLIHAVGAEDRAIVDVLLEAGADIDQRSDWWAGSFGVLDHGSDSMAEYMLARGATLTPHAAARLGRIEYLSAMIEADPSVVHERGGDGQLPLHFARTRAIADLLLAKGADIDARDIDHESTAAQWLATSRPDVAMHLVVRGCQVDPILLAAAGDLERLPAVLQGEPEGIHVRITRERFAVSQSSALHIYFYTIGEGCGLLHAASLGGHVEVIRWLIDQGCDPDMRGGYDDATPLHVAAWHDRADAIGALVEGGADVDLRSGSIHDNEPLGWAIVAGAPAAAKALLACGATVRTVHRSDARAGAGGKFLGFNRARPLSDWQAIAGLIDPV